ncbi:MAG: hypothetical protein HETSPECPRED_002976 [Heterodermia speciosa]|uniref:tRNA-splicing endonuclease subunit Sen2 n=1 Tax=Heterodermia speciosa TaxID=116794 RepID=A0A8H3F3T7_9LECA|nr:MAG: hypothetical protein HETSPECPRED_002976 [Heterodermia speciosa]
MIIAAWWPDLRSWPWSNKSAHQAEKPINGRPPRAPRPNYNKIHAQPLPVNAYPLPPFIAHNPLSWLHIAAVYIRENLSPPPSHPEPHYRALWLASTGTIHVTDEQTIRALWEKGFFGKGSLSRSEPTWLEREKRKLGVSAADTSEQWTRQRREERRQFKNERAKKEREAIEERLRQETGDAANGTAVVRSENQREISIVHEEQTTISSSTPPVNGPPNQPSSSHLPNPPPQHLPLPLTIPNREHLQLSPEETFFLVYALDALTIHLTPTSPPLPLSTLLNLLCTHSTFPPTPTPTIPPSNPFLISYTVYHHFRSLGWVVRPGIKFGVDYLLYQRGPAFAHAQFSIVVVPSYRHAYWRGRQEAEVGRKGKSWWWVHAVNRVQSQVLKNLVLVFVEVPPPVGAGEGERDGQGGGDGQQGQGEEIKDITSLLKRYKIRELVLKRWTPNRSRD